MTDHATRLIRAHARLVELRQAVVAIRSDHLGGFGDLEGLPAAEERVRQQEAKLDGIQALINLACQRYLTNDNPKP